MPVSPTAAAYDGGSADGRMRRFVVTVTLLVFIGLSWTGGFKGVDLVVVPGGGGGTAGTAESGGARASADLPGVDVGQVFETPTANDSATGAGPAAVAELEPPLPVPKVPQVDDVSLEYAPGSRALFFWQRKIDSAATNAELRKKTAEASEAALPRRARMACMYAGFMRNWEWMMGTCREMQTTKFCAYPRCRKLFGNQRRNLLNSTGCDVYISTWHIRGPGRYDVHRYSKDVKSQLPVDRVMRLYERWLFALHVQNYTLYEPIWDDMHRYARSFPQTRPTVQYGKEDPLHSSWSGVPVTNRYLRRNDYSQSYKHWCVLQLVLRSGIDYDVYFRLRTDLRMIRQMTPPTVAGNGHIRWDMVYNNGSRTKHRVHDSRVHVNNYDVADFGFMGSPAVIKPLSIRAWEYCKADPDPSIPPVKYVRGDTISEYNLMLWRVIFDAKWEVDSGHRYLWVSRSRDHCKKKKAEMLADKARMAYEAAARARNNGTVPDDDGGDD